MFVLALGAWVVLARAGFVAPGPEPPAVRIATWLFAGLFALNTVGNVASTSPVERYLMAPVTLLLVGCFVAAALMP
jgi:hypothetical protein